MICPIFGNLGLKKYMHVLTIAWCTKYRINFEGERDGGRNRICPKVIFSREGRKAFQWSGSQAYTWAHFLYMLTQTTLLILEQVRSKISHLFTLAYIFPLLNFLEPNEIPWKIQRFFSQITKEDLVSYCFSARNSLYHPKSFNVASSVLPTLL